MTTTEKTTKRLPTKKPRRRIREQRVLWLAQDIYARYVTSNGDSNIGSANKMPATALAMASLEAARVFFEVATKPEKK